MKYLFNIFYRVFPFCWVILFHGMFIRRIVYFSPRCLDNFSLERSLCAHKSLQCQQWNLYPSKGSIKKKETLWLITRSREIQTERNKQNDGKRNYIPRIALARMYRRLFKRLLFLLVHLLLSLYWRIFERLWIRSRLIRQFFFSHYLSPKQRKIKFNLI